MERFINLHEILLPKDSYQITLFDTSESNIIIDYFKLKINYLLDDLKIYLELQFEPNQDFQLLLEQTHTFRLLVSVQNNLVHQNFKPNTNIPDYWMMSNEPNIIEYLMELNKLLSIDMIEKQNYCTICGFELSVKSLGKISYCDKIDCKNNYYMIPTDNRVIELSNRDSKTFLFLVNILLAGLSHPKASITFNPLPFIPNITTVEQLIKILPSELYLHLDNNYFSMNSGEKSLTKSNIKSNTKFMTQTDINTQLNIGDDSLFFININYSAHIENTFQRKYFLFHGSLFYCWYPIIKNGLKVMSGTSLQANGAAYGHGIYFSDSYSMSLNYSSFRSGNFCSNHFCSNHFDQCVGVFEIQTEPSNYKKTTNIFVIPDEKILLLRNLIVSKSNNSQRNHSNITNYFIKVIPMQKVVNTGNILILKNKRLNSEYNKLSSETFISKINIINGNGTNWIIDFNPISNKLIQIELIFSNYPLVPPIIKMLSNININGLVNSNKEIQIDLINPANWKITNNLKEICEYIYNCISNSI